MEITIGERVLSGPILIPSVSRFETQGSPVDAIRLQHALNEPISLVSAHDTVSDDVLVASVELFRDAGRVVFLDSGGYEASRISKYLPGYLEDWTIAKYEEAASRCPYDLAASFDYFWDGESSDYGVDLVDSLRDHHFIPREKIVPVVHLKTFAGDRYLSSEEAVNAVDRVAAEIEPNFVAIPERELGAGLREKLELTRNIVDRLRKADRKTHLHVLGCGNPLTFALLSSAGIAMADGLEWCRTLVGPQFHLHHFQQADQFDEPKNNVYNPMAELIRDESEGYLVRALSRNLHALQGYQRAVAQAIEERTMKQFVESNFGPAAAAIL